MRKSRRSHFLGRFILALVLFSITVIFTSYNSPQRVYAASLYWVGGTAGDANNWNNANNWAASSGGAGGAGIPTASDAVTFDSGSAVNCTLTAQGDALSITNTAYAGTLSLANQTLNVGDMTFKKGVLDLSSGNLNISGNSDFRDQTTNSLSITPGTSTVTLSGTSKTIYGGKETFNNVNVSGTIGIPYVSGATSDFYINGTLTVGSSKTLTFNLGANVTLNKGSSLSLDGTLARAADSSIVFVDPTSSTVGMTGAINPSVYFKTSTQDIYIQGRTYGGDVYIINETSSNFTAYLGTTGSQTLDFAGTGADIEFRANGTGNLTIDGSLYNPTITTASTTSYQTYFRFSGSGAGSEVLNTGSGTWTVGQSRVDFRNGTVNAGTSNFVFNRGYSLYNQTIYTGGNTFYQITNANADTHGSDAGLVFMDSVTADTFTYTSPVGVYKVQFNPGITATFTNFNVSGEAGKVVILQPYASSASWNLNVTNKPTLSYVSASYSNASGGSVIDADNGTNTDGGSNINWDFNASVTVSGTVYSAEDKLSNIGADKTIGLSINGAAKSTVETTDGGAFSFTATVQANNTVSLFIDDESEDAFLVTQAVDEDTGITGLELYVNKAVLRHQTAGPMTNTLLAIADNSGDDDITGAYTTSGANVSFANTYELWIDDDKTYNPGGTVSCGDLEIRPGATMAQETNGLAINGSFSNSATSTFSSSGITTFSASSGTRTIDAGGDSFTNMVINDNAGTATFTPTSSLAINGYLTITDGVFDQNSYDSDINISGNLTVSSGASLLASNSAVLSVAGNISAAGTFSPNDGTLTISGVAGQTVNLGSNSTYNLTITNAHTDGVSFSSALTVTGTFTDTTPSSKLKFTAGQTYAINDLVLNGQAAGTKVILTSLTPGTYWYLDLTGTQSVSYVSVTDSNASLGFEVIANDGTSTNSGHNVNWLWPAQNYYWVGDASNSWNNYLNWSSSSGGSGGYGTPGSVDSAVFDNGSSEDCIIDTTVSITSLIGTNFSGTLDGSASNVSISGDLSFNSGTLILGSDAWTVSGNVNLVGTSLNSGTASFTINQNGKTLTMSNGQLFHDLIFSNPSSAFSSTIAVSGYLGAENLYLTTNTTKDINLDLSTSNAHADISGEIDFTGSGSGNEKILMGNGTWTVGGDIDLRNGSIEAGGSILIMTGEDVDLWGNNQTFNDLTMAQTTLNVPYIWNGTASFAIDGTLSIPAGKNLAMHLSQTVTLNNGSLLSLGGSISYNGGGALTVIDPSSDTIAQTGTISTPVTFKSVTGNITIPCRDFDGSVYIVNETESNFTATLCTSAGQTIDVYGNFQIKANSSGNIVVDGTTYNPTFSSSNYGGYRNYFGFAGTGNGSETLNTGSGNWTIGQSDVDLRNGTFNAGASTFTFNRDYSLYNQTVYSGSNSFYNIINANTDTHGTDCGLSFLDSVTAYGFTYTTPTGSRKTQFAPGTTATFNNFNVAGSAGQLLYFQPYESSSAWNLRVINQPTVSYVQPSYSNASSGSEIIAYNGTNADGGNNINWAFAVPTASPTATVNPSATSTANPTETSTPADEDDSEEGSYPAQTKTPVPSVSSRASSTPALPAIINMLDDSLPTAGRITVDAGDTIVGISPPNSSVQVIIDGTLYQTTADQDGNWQIAIDQKPGEYKAKIINIDPSGKITEKEVSIQVLGYSKTSPKNKQAITIVLSLFSFAVLIFLIIFYKRRKKKK